MVCAAVVSNFGRTDQVDREALHRRARSLHRLDAGEGSEFGLVVERSRPLGGTHVLEHLWQQLGIAAQPRELLEGQEYESDVEPLLCTLVANRWLAPSSKLGACEWVAREVVIPHLDQLEPQQAYRAIDVLPENQEEVQERVFFQVADLLLLEVGLIFSTPPPRTLGSRVRTRTMAFAASDTAGTVARTGRRWRSAWR